MSHPLVSIITPCYNARRFLASTWRSIRQQSYRNWEWVVADDGSTDGSREWLEQLAVRDRRVRLARGPRRGQPAAMRNRAIELARGEYLALLDADDLWHREKLARQIEHMATRSDIDVCYTEVIDFWVTNGQRRSRYPSAIWPSISLVEDPRSALLRHGNIPCTSSMLIRREALEVVGPFNESAALAPSEDYEWNLRASHQATFGLLAEPLTAYRLHDENASIGKPIRNAAELLRIVNGYDQLDDPAGRRFRSNIAIQEAEAAMAKLDASARRHLCRAWRLAPAAPERIAPVAVSLLPVAWMGTVYGWMKSVQRRMRG